MKLSMKNKEEVCRVLRIDDRGFFDLLVAHAAFLRNDSELLEEKIMSDDALYKNAGKLLYNLDYKPGRADVMLEIANLILNGHGVEAIRVEGTYVDSHYLDIVALYVNMGDTYDATVLYDTREEKFLVTSWGDFCEAMEAKEV